MVPRAFETWVTATIFVLLLSSFRYSSRSISPLSSTGITLRIAPLRSHIICHGTMLAWCSRWLIITSSPCFIYLSPNENARAFIEPVVPEVNTTSSLFPAFMKDLTFSLAFSYRSEEHTSELQSRLHLVC